jgi:hypothetical protein
MNNVPTDSVIKIMKYIAFIYILPFMYKENMTIRVPIKKCVLIRNDLLVDNA